MYLGRKHVEVGASFSHKFATILKYHMPLINTLFLIFCVNLVFWTREATSSLVQNQEQRGAQVLG